AHLAGAEIEHVALERADDGAYPRVVAREGVALEVGLVEAGAARARLAAVAEPAAYERAQVADEVVGGVLARDVDVDLAELVRERRELGGGEVAGIGPEAGDARPVLHDEVPAAISRGHAVLAARAEALGRGGREQRVEDVVEGVAPLALGDGRELLGAE